MLSPQQIQEVRNKVWLADQAMAQRDHELFCKRIWEATAHAIKCVAQEKGWPCQTFDEIYAAGRRMAKAHLTMILDGRRLWAQRSCCVPTGRDWFSKSTKSRRTGT